MFCTVSYLNLHTLRLNCCRGYFFVVWKTPSLHSLFLYASSVITCGLSHFSKSIQFIAWTYNDNSTLLGKCLSMKWVCRRVKGSIWVGGSLDLCGDLPSFSRTLVCARSVLARVVLSSSPWKKMFCLLYLSAYAILSPCSVASNVDERPHNCISTISKSVRAWDRCLHVDLKTFSCVSSLSKSSKRFYLFYFNVKLSV